MRGGEWRGKEGKRDESRRSGTICMAKLCEEQQRGGEK